MTLDQLIVEILNTAGEGYEEWGERAKSAFKRSVIELALSDKYGIKDYPIMYHSGDYVAQEPATSVSLAGMLPSKEILRIFELAYYEWDVSEYLSPVYYQLLDYAQYRAYSYNNNLILKNDMLPMLIDSSQDDVILTINLNTMDKITYKALWWDAAWFVTYGDSTIDTWWSPDFLDAAKALALEYLSQEIKR
jgi:hypothetical protein